MTPNAQTWRTIVNRGAFHSAGVAGSAVAAAVGSSWNTGRQWLAYTHVMQTLHWGTSTLLLGVYAIAWTIDSASSPADTAWLITLHRSLGIAILLITVLRVVIRQRTRVPSLPANLPAAQPWLARIGAVSLYALLILQPMLGLAASVLHGDRIVLFGTLALPRLLTEDRAMAHALFQVHGTAASAFLALIGLHATAALYHHFVRHDHVLVAMLPGARMASGGTGRTP
jgi:cytochrome b561